MYVYVQSLVNQWRGFQFDINLRTEDLGLFSKEVVNRFLRFEPLSSSFKRLRASMKMSTFERKYSPGYRHMICNGKAKQQAKMVC